MTDNNWSDLLAAEAKVDGWILKARELFLQRMEEKAAPADLNDIDRMSYIAAALDQFERDHVPILREQLRACAGARSAPTPGGMTALPPPAARDR